MSSVVISAIAASHTYPLRSAVLRTGLPVSTCIFAGDDEATTYHYGAFVAQQLVGIVSIYRVDNEELTAQQADFSWQLRAMATHPQVRGLGVGKALVQHALAQHGSSAPLWCNARSHACGFYQKLGFAGIGASFEIPGVGPHLKMMFVEHSSGSAID
ncbi:GNAT family N-acetyltransferase [Corallincola luteus]|uniref:GNAT family N-acetyltransferase n=1 Tax=Corallincola luteus TaxID=1775177 RepID=A0ABY2AN95_9GAMM|nr:GNAT family N-acetyltransferase [Corallincola luteus]TCI03144.1 GNAT family N-acetyltransferase [Corallincola luteus]